MLNVLPKQVETDGRARERERERERERKRKRERERGCVRYWREIGKREKERVQYVKKINNNRFASKYDILKFSLDVYCLCHMACN